MHKTIKKNIVIALFLALSIIMNYFEITIPGFFKITFDGPFYKFIAIIFGPLYGGFVAGFAQIFGYLFNPTSSYKPIFSFTASMRGFLVGFLWKILDLSFLSQKINEKKIFKLIRLIISISMTDFLVSIINSFALKYYLFWPKEVFIYKLGTRLFKESILIIINIFALTIMLEIYDNIINKDIKKEN